MFLVLSGADQLRPLGGGMSLHFLILYAICGFIKVTFSVMHSCIFQGQSEQEDTDQDYESNHKT